MEGLTRKQVDAAESKDFSLGHGPLRPRDAATLVLLDRSAGNVRVLMGRRHHKHAFMPGKFVFPGGRTDPTDSRIQTASELDPAEQAKLEAHTRVTPIRARAIALSAIRETYEEAGLLIGKRGEFGTNKSSWQGFGDNNVVPALDCLRFIARAITPPGRVRRFDTRFLATWRDKVAVALPSGPTEELEELVWLPIAQAKELDLPGITKTILEDLEERLDADPMLKPGGPVPFYRMLHNRFRRDLL